MGLRLKVENNAGGYPDVLLCSAGKTRGEIVDLHAGGEERNQFVVGSSAEGVSECRLRTRETRYAGVEMRHSK